MSRDRKLAEDDGRTVADMSGVEGPNLFSFRRTEKTAEGGKVPSSQHQQERPWEDHSLSRSERWAAVLGAWKAAILIALAYIIGLGLVVLAIGFLLG